MAETTDAPKADLILTGGHVIDPANGIDGPSDVAIADGKIVAVGPNLSTTNAEKVIDVSGHYVTPGIIDMHVHCFHTHKRSRLSLDPIVNTFSAGVTTVVDAGTSGYRDFEDFKNDVIDKSRVRVLAFVNIVGSGMLGPWESDPAEFKPKLAAAMVDAFPDVAVGIKTAHYWANRTYQPFTGAATPWLAVESAVEAGELCGKPVMVDHWPWIPERTYPDLILTKLRPGDIHTHVFAQHFPIVDDEGKVFDHMWQARERGIIFDVGHGAASFWFRNAVPAIRQGFAPDSISTDLHTGNLNGAVISMLTTMNKILNIGMPLADVIAKSTVAPAKEVGHPELGTLSVGSEADVAVFKLHEGKYSYVDCGKNRFDGDKRLECHLTLRAGEIVWNPEGLGLDTWENDPGPRWWELTTPKEQLATAQ